MLSPSSPSLLLNKKAISEVLSLMKLKNALTKTENTFEGKMENVEKDFYNQVVKMMNIKSKKRRIRNKAFKKAISSMNEKNTLAVETKKSELKEVPTVSLTESNAVEVKSSPKQTVEAISLKGISITFLLKLGKQYFRDEDVVRGYYKKDEPTYYKNKELLIDTLEKQYLNLSAGDQTEVSNMIKEELNKKTKK